MLSTQRPQYTFLLFLAFFLFAPHAYATYQSTIQAEPTLLNYWPMTEASGTTLTAAAGGVNINLTGGVTMGATGQVGTAASFNGINNTGVTASTIDLSSYNKVAVEAMVNFNSYATNPIVWELSSDSNAVTTGLYYTPNFGGNGKAAVAVKGNVGYNYSQYNQPSLSQWHHVVAVYDKSLSTNETELYIDGVLQTATSRPLLNNNTNNFGNLNFYLMARGGTSLFGNGKMQHLAIYSALSGSQIASHAALAAQSSTLSLSGPTSGMINAASTNFTTSVNGVIAGSLVITPSDGANGGTFTPTTVTLTSGSPTATFTYTPATVGTKIISITNDGGLTNPTTISYAAQTPATAVTLSGPTTGSVLISSGNFSVGTNGAVSGSVIITPSDGANGGTFTPTTVTLTPGSPTATFTYTPATSGTKVISITNNGSLTNPSSINLVVTYATYQSTIQGESTLLNYWPMTESSGTTLTAAVGGVNINLTGGATLGTAGQVGNAVSFDGINDTGVTASTIDLSSYNKVAVEAMVNFNNYPGTFKNAWEFSSNAITAPDGFGYAYDGSQGTGTQADLYMNGNAGVDITLYTRNSLNQWHHVVAVYDKSLSTNETSFYVDGVLVTPFSRPNNSNNTNNFGNQLFYLMSRGGTSLFGSGKMQHLAIYSDLSAQKIADHSILMNRASAVTLTGPTLGVKNSASSNFTVGLNGAVLESTVITPSDGANGGTFTPTTVTLTSGSPTATFTYTPTTVGTKTISVTNALGFTNPASISFVATTNDPATATSLSGPTSGVVNTASTNFTASANGVISGSLIITPSDGGNGGTFTPTTVTLTSGSPTATFTYTPATVGTKTISVTNNGGLTNPTTIRYISSGVGIILGDSTIADLAPYPTVASYLYTSQQVSDGWLTTSIAHGGDRISSQKTTYLSTPNKSSYDYAIVEIGLNDINPGAVATDVIASLQDLINTINANKKPSALTIIATMSPMKQRLVDLFGSFQAIAAQNVYLAVNAAIKGEGATPITGVDYRISKHTTLLGDGAGNLAATYNSGDNIHENEAGRQVIARTWRDALATVGILDPAAPSAPNIGTAATSNGVTTVSFTEPDFIGGSAITSYTVTSTPGNITATGSSSPITVTGLTNNTSYTFTVTATNSIGTGSASSASNSVTPTAPPDTTPPDTTITPLFTDPTTNTTVSFVLTANETATFECSLDSASYTSCLSSYTTPTLAPGTHTLNARAIDTASNVDASPATFTWTINALPSNPQQTTPVHISSGGYLPSFIKALSITPTPLTQSPITQPAPRTLKLNLKGDDIKTLQIYLNTHGYPVSLTGPGSKGKETTLFGTKTKQAVQRFQKAHKLTPDGVVGKKTLSLMK